MPWTVVELLDTWTGDFRDDTEMPAIRAIDPEMIEQGHDICLALHSGTVSQTAQNLDLWALTRNTFGQDLKGDISLPVAIASEPYCSKATLAKSWSSFRQHNSPNARERMVSGDRRGKSRRTKFAEDNLLMYHSVSVLLELIV